MIKASQLLNVNASTFLASIVPYPPQLLRAAKLLRPGAVVLQHLHRIGTLGEAEDASGLLDGQVVRHALLLPDGVPARREDDVELLERPLLGLDQEEVDDGDEEEVEDGEDDVLFDHELAMRTITNPR